MVPFWTVAASDEPDKFYQVGGYAVSKDGVTQLRLFNASGDGTFGETLAEVPGTVLSLTEYAPTAPRWRFTCCARRMACAASISTMR